MQMLNLFAGLIKFFFVCVEVKVQIDYLTLLRVLLGFFIVPTFLKTGRNVVFGCVSIFFHEKPAITNIIAENCDITYLRPFLSVVIRTILSNFEKVFPVLVFAVQ